jgi:hypothetical protein
MLEDPVKISLVIEREDADALEKLAESSGILFSDYVRKVLGRHLAGGRRRSGGARP